MKVYHPPEEPPRGEFRAEFLSEGAAKLSDSCHAPQVTQKLHQSPGKKWRYELAHVIYFCTRLHAHRKTPDVMLASSWLARSMVGNL